MKYPEVQKWEVEITTKTCHELEIKARTLQEAGEIARKMCEEFQDERTLTTITRLTIAE